ncbi:hypothetical protein RUND412_011507, partial [Rhizina undulata]
VINTQGIDFQDSNINAKEHKYTTKNTGKFFKAWEIYKDIRIWLAPQDLCTRLASTLSIYMATLIMDLKGYYQIVRN